MRRIIFSIIMFTMIGVSCSKGPQSLPNNDQPPVTPEILVTPIPSGVMPVIRINTENNTPITSREEYLSASLSVESENDNQKNLEVNIRGRGNSSWYNAEKKSYRLKFEEKESLLGRAKDKSWALVANYFDKSMLRNELAFHMSRMSCLAYTPKTDFVELYINGSYEGVYMLVDHLKTGSHRVDADYLLEIDVRAEEDDIKVTVPYLSQPVVVKDPDDISYTSDEYLYIDDYLSRTGNAIYDDAFAVDKNGYKSLIDIKSFVDWYLINEIAKNNDAIMYTSCYMNCSVDGKLFMGPVWDFDIAFGNVNYNDNDKPEGLWIAEADWYNRMLTDPEFMSLVKERFMFFYNKRNEIYDFIDDYAAYLKPYIDKNEERWQTMDKLLWANNEVFPTYEEYISSLKKWMEKRFNWMNENYSL